MILYIEIRQGSSFCYFMSLGPIVLLSQFRCSVLVQVHVQFSLYCNRLV